MGSASHSARACPESRCHGYPQAGFDEAQQGYSLTSRQPRNLGDRLRGFQQILAGMEPSRSGGFHSGTRICSARGSRFGTRLHGLKIQARPAAGLKAQPAPHCGSERPQFRLRAGVFIARWVRQCRGSRYFPNKGFSRFCRAPEGRTIPPHRTAEGTTPFT